jgi:hypothetical protein
LKKEADADALRKGHHVDMALAEHWPSLLMSFLIHYGLAKWIAYRSWVEEPMVLNGTAAYSIVFHQGKGKSKTVGGVPAVIFRKVTRSFREGGQ